MNNTEENSHQHQSKLNLRICGGEHKVSTLKQVQEVVTPQEELRKEPNKNGKLTTNPFLRDCVQGMPLLSATT